jgi:hypothetical protein
MIVWRQLLQVFAPPGRVALGEPKHINGDALIQFRGDGLARFRVQHTRDDDGLPDHLTWSDVSMVSNGRIDPRTVVRDHSVRVLVDVVDGDRDFHYRQHRANWLRVLPNEDQDEEARARCYAYKIAIRAAP